MSDYFKSNKELEIYKNFDSMKLDEDLLMGIYSYGFEKPSPIQQRIIVPMIETKKDIIAQAHSGTGKTGAFSISSLQMTNTDNKTQILVLSPTRELTEQTYEVYKNIAQYKKIKIHLSIGGTNRSQDIRELKKNPQVVIATPGRCYDMIQTNALVVNNLKCIIIDEADDMLAFGFKEQLVNIFKYIPDETQVALFSATMPDEILKLANTFMRDPITILIKKDHITLVGIKQYFVNVNEESNKYGFILDLFKTTSFPQAILFCNSKKKVEWLRDNIAQTLDVSNSFIGFIHGELSKEERKKALNDFKSMRTRILISSELISRGIDIQHVKLVINYDLPKSKNNYIHRIGRSGRMGRKGIAINIINTNEIKYLLDIRNHFNTQIDELPENYNTIFG